MLQKLFLIFTLILSNPAFALPQGYEVIPQKAFDTFYMSQEGDKLLHTESLRGKVIVMHFWSMACPSCIKEIPDVDRFMLSLPPGVVFLPICMGKTTASQLKNFFTEKRALNIPIYFNPGKTSPVLKGLPTTLFIDKQGRLVGQILGPHPWNDPELYKVIKRLDEGLPEPKLGIWENISEYISKIFFAQAKDLARIVETKGNKTMTSNHSKVLILGSGPAGYTAAIYATRANLQTRLITGNEPGGQLTVTTDVENYPGFADVIQGPWLMAQMSAQAKNVGTEIIHDQITSADLSKKPFTLKSEAGKTYTCDTLIISTGAQARWLGLETEKKFRGYGVSGCATCDGFFFKDRPVAVIGGGNTAVEDALYMSRFAKKVYLVHRRDSLRAEKILQDRLFKNPKIEMVWDHEVQEITGTENPLGVTGVTLTHVKTKALKKLTVDGVFVAIGHTPRSELFKGQLDIASDGYINVKPGTTQTNIPGVFAAGDVADRVYRQAVTAAGLGCMSALEAQHYLATLEEQQPKGETAKVQATK